MTYESKAANTPYSKSFEVSVGLHEIIDLDLEGFNDLIGELVGNPLLMDIDFKPIGVNEDGSIIISVIGDDSEREIDEGLIL